MADPALRRFGYSVIAAAIVFVVNGTLFTYGFGIAWLVLTSGVAAAIAVYGFYRLLAPESKLTGGEIPIIAVGIVIALCPILFGFWPTDHDGETDWPWLALMVTFYAALPLCIGLGFGLRLDRKEREENIREADLAPDADMEQHFEDEQASPQVAAFIATGNPYPRGVAGTEGSNV